jgi:hypothetical protein
VRGEVADVAARHEVLACSLDDDNTQRVIGGKFRGVRNEGVDHRGIERVERVRSVERQRRDGPVAGKQHGVVHRASLGESRAIRRAGNAPRAARLAAILALVIVVHG